MSNIIVGCEALLEADKFVRGCGYKIFLAKEQLQIQAWAAHTLIVDISNAMLPGKVCNCVSVESFTDNNCDDMNFIRRAGGYKAVMDLYAQHCAGGESREPMKGIMIHPRTMDSNRKFSALEAHACRVKRLKETPKKWTLPLALRAIFNGQYSDLRCNQVLTDDYAFDAAVGFQAGTLKNNRAFVQGIMGAPHGWWVGNNGQDARVSVCCHSFDSNEFTFDLEAGR